MRFLSNVLISVALVAISSSVHPVYVHAITEPKNPHPFLAAGVTATSAPFPLPTGTQPAITTYLKLLARVE